MGKIHELIAVEPNLEQIARNASTEAVGTFGTADRFAGSVKKLHMFNEGRQEENTETLKEVTTTVDEKLEYLRGPLQDWFNVVYQKEKGNQSAVADVVVNDVVIVPAAPVSFLLNLEKRLNEVRTVLLAIPTLRPGMKWVPADDEQRRGVFACDDAEKFKTEKTMEIIIATEATPQHKATYETLSKDVAVGKITERLFSGAISSSRKSDMLHRTDTLIMAVKKARMKANDSEAPGDNVAKEIFDYILG